MNYLNLILGTIVFIVVLMIVLMIYVKIKHKFWSNQPVFHVYSLRNWLFPKGIIEHTLPVPNKFCDFFFTKTIEMKSFEKSSSETKKQYIYLFSPELQKHFTNFITKNYLQTKVVKYSPTSENIFPYFRHHNHDCYLTYYINQIKDISSIAGYITSRPLEIYLDGRNLMLYYVDYLCVDKNQRKKGIAPTLIQSHIYQQRHKNVGIDIILFKRETKLNLLVPLVIYISYGFNLYYWKVPKIFQPQYKMVRITSQNFYLCREILHTTAKNKFNCVVYPNSGNFLHLIDTKNILMYAVVRNKEVVAVYIFRDSCTTVNKDKIVDCIGSVSNIKDNTLFILGFHHCVFHLRKIGFSFINIENISNNDCIIENILTKYTPNSVSNTAYYFYNFATAPKLSKDVLIIS